MSVRRAQLEIDSVEFTEWDIINTIDPCGEIRADIRNALTRQTLIQCHGNKKTRIPPLRELIIDYWKIRRFPGKEAVIKKMKQWMANRLAARKLHKEQRTKRK